MTERRRAARRRRCAVDRRPRRWQCRRARVAVGYRTTAQSVKVSTSGVVSRERAERPCRTSSRRCERRPAGPTIQSAARARRRSCAPRRRRNRPPARPRRARRRRRAACGEADRLVFCEPSPRALDAADPRRHRQTGRLPDRAPRRRARGPPSWDSGAGGSRITIGSTMPLGARARPTAARVRSSALSGKTIASARRRGAPANVGEKVHLRRDARAKGAGNRRMHETREVAAVARDLANEAGADVRRVERRHHVHGLESRRQMAIHERHLILVFEIAHGAQPADQQLRALRATRSPRAGR